MTDNDVVLSREQVLRYRWRATGLDAAAESVPLTSVAGLELGIQDGANAAGVLGLVNRGARVPESIAATSEFGEELALVWSVRGAPHFVRRADLPDLEVALSPFSEADAGKRILLAAKTLTKAGVGAIDGMQEFASAMREAVPTHGETISKGELSTRLHKALPLCYQVACRRCKATHPHEQLFRLGALHAGLELEPGTNPPNLRRIRRWPRRKPGFAKDPLLAEDSIQVSRAYLHFLGPASAREIASYLDTNVGELKAHWPEDVVDVSVGGRRLSALAEDIAALKAASEPDSPQLRLLSGFDLFMAAKDREFIVPDERHRKELWPMLGRPGVVAIDGEVIGAWRPKSAKQKLTVRVTLWGSAWPDTSKGIDRLAPDRTEHPKVATLIETQAERIAAARGQTLAGIELED